MNAGEGTPVAWFVVAVVFAVQGATESKIADAAFVAADRLNWSADGRWLRGVPDYVGRYGNDTYMVSLDLADEHTKMHRRFNPRGLTNYLLRVPTQDVSGLESAAIVELLAASFRECCDDSAKRWGVLVPWRDSVMSSPSSCFNMHLKTAVASGFSSGSSLG